MEGVGGGRGGSVVKSTGCPCRGHRFGAQHSQGSSLHPATPVKGVPTSSSGKDTYVIH